MSGSPDATPARPPVVVAVGPDGSDAGLRHAVTLALHDRVALHVLHVVEMPASGTGPVAAELLEVIAREGAHVLDRATAQARDLVAGAVSVTGELAHGDVTGRVVVSAATSSYVVLQQAARPDVRPRAGEVCSQVAARVDVPVVCVPTSWGDGLRPRTVTVAVKDPVTSSPLVGQAARAATAIGAGLRVLHVAAADEHAEARGLLEDLLEDRSGLPRTAWVDVVEGLTRCRAPRGRTLGAAARPGTPPPPPAGRSDPGTRGPGPGPSLGVPRPAGDAPSVGVVGGVGLPDRVGLNLPDGRHDGSRCSRPRERRGRRTSITGQGASSRTARATDPRWVPGSR